MKKLYSSPLRVYLLLGTLALAGIIAGFRLPISLFPNSSKPEIWFSIPYGSLTAEEFLNTYGKGLEDQIRGITTDKVEVERIEATYGSRAANYDVHFKWGVAPNSALKEVQTLVNAYLARLPDESRDGLRMWLDNENSGFFAVSFYSDTRDLDELFEYMEPILGPRIARVKDAQDPVLWNPSSKEVRVIFDPNTLASLQLFPRDIDTAIAGALGGRTGGSITEGTNQLTVEMPRRLKAVSDLGLVPLPTPSGRMVHLGDVARVELGPKTHDSRTFKTNGAPSLILYAVPRPGGNVKQMSEDLLRVVEEMMPTLPKDVRYRVLVDPSEFIRSAVSNVFREVAIAALLAVIVLFLFIGSFRNVVTAAIEIPLSMILAFIMMKITGMNLNLISLGGLALSAGMNVDASVVVMENIFRHFEMNPGPHDGPSRLKLVVKAVKEVRFSVIASTIASLVVFLPLTFTSDLSYAILGDLALAVVFSHGFSAFVALLLVPTVRLHLMKSGKDVGHAHSPIERPLTWLESWYARSLGRFIESSKLKLFTYAGLGVALVALVVLVIPRLPKEIVGSPDTDWMVLSISTDGNSLVRQMDVQAQEIERQLMTEFGSKIRYTFSQANSPNNAFIMSRLTDKREMREVWKAMEKRFSNTPLFRFWVGPWNPSELPIPRPPDMRIAVRGGTLRDRASTTKEVLDLLNEKHAYPRLKAEPSADMAFSVEMTPHIEQWAALGEAKNRFFPSDLADLVRVATQGRRTGYLPIKDKQTDIILQFPANNVTSIEEIAALPVGASGKIVPLKALASVRRAEATPAIYREDHRELFKVEGNLPSGDENKDTAGALANAKKIVGEWEAKRPKPATGVSAPTVAFEDGAKDLNDAIHQLSIAVALSIGLIFLTMLFQFGSFVEPLLVLVSIPSGFIGVLVALFVFQSKLSLNSILGVILLNGISVANSILLVDFMKRLVETGMAPRLAAVEAARKRLRPILITSLTTGLGMLPVALGLGEGGRILQPLGIAVSGGLWVSMVLTLFLVPALQVSYLEWRQERKEEGSIWNKLGVKMRLKLPWQRATIIPLLLLSLTAHAAEIPVSAPQAISFDDAIQKIVERHPEIGVERANLSSLEGKNLSSHLSLLPSVSLFARERRDNALGQTNIKRGYGLTADMNLLHFGADVAAMRAANAEESAQESVIGASILKVEDDGVRALTTAIQSELELAVQQKIVAMWEAYHKIARERYRQGRLASQEADKVEIDFQNAKAQMRDTESALVNARAQLTALLGEGNVAPAWPWRERLQKADAIMEGASPDLSARPDWAAAAKRSKAVGHRESQALGNALPSIDLNVTYGQFENRGPALTANGPEWSGQLALTIPLFDRLANYGNYRSLVHRTAAAELELEKVRRFARADWDGAKGALNISVTTAKSREATVEISRRLYEDNQRRFRQGLAGANEVSVDQERFYRAEILAIRGWQAAHVNLVRACHAQGLRIADCLKTIH